MMHTPPKFANRLLSFFCKPAYLEDIQGDLEEEFYEMLDSRSAAKAERWYYWQVVKLLKPGLIKKIKTQEIIEKETVMFRNYLKIGFRNLWKYKAGTFINVLGLALGLAAFMLIALFVKDELSYDKHFANAKDIYRVTVKNFNANGEVNRHWAFASAGHAERLKQDYSFITHAVRFHLWVFPDLSYGDKKLPNEQVVFADNDVFEIFSFPFLIGDPNTAFDDVHSIVLTETSAEKIFGEDWRELELLEKPIRLSKYGAEQNFKITGVMKDMPDQQHFHFEYLAPLRFLENFFGESLQNVGGNYNWLTYIKTNPNATPSETKTLSDEFFNKYIGDVNGAKASNFYEFEFQPLLDIHLRSNLEGEVEANGSVQQLTIFSIVGVLLLLVACVNYMNLSTSHYSRRLKEVGIRKVIGAYKTSLIKQFLTESTIVILISFPFAILLALLALPYLNHFMAKNLSFDPSQNFLLIMVFTIIILVGAIAGTYPAFFLSRINLVNALKGEQTVRASKWNFRAWLVTFQYAVTIALIFALIVIENQMQFIQKSDPGYNREQIVRLNVSGAISNLQVFKQEILKHPNITKAAYASRIPTGRLADNMGSSFYAGDSAVRIDYRLPYISVDEDFMTTFEIDLIAGEDFKKNQDMVQDSIGYYIINRTAAKKLGFENPQDIIGKKLAYGPYNGDALKVGTIQGVTEDFHFESLHSEIIPMVMLKSSDNIRALNIKIDPQNMQESLTHIENTFASFAPELTAYYSFVDDLFDQQYQQEERLSTMITVFTLIAIFIGCLGLIGMVGFVIETKYKEIGIRKVLGASIPNIMYVIGYRFFVLIGIAFAVAIPLTYYYISDWLNGFVYKTPISIVLILMPALAAIALTFMAIGYQTIRASLVNPVECLKDE